jgi:hypothetical protein
VIRTLSCPANATFYQLHQALQVAFGWASTHTFGFAVVDPEYDVNEDGPANIEQFIQERMLVQTNGGRTESMMREYILRVVDSPAWPAGGFGPVDRVHEAIRKHPRTEEKKAETYRLWQMFDNLEYQSRLTSCCISQGV